MQIQLTGDSLIARHEGLAEPMLNVALHHCRPDLVIRNTAVCGDNTFDLLMRLSRDVLVGPTVDRLYILIGTNDLAQHKQVPLAFFEANLKEILRQTLWVYQADQLYFISPPAVDERRQHVRNNHLVARYAQALAGVVTPVGCHYLDLQAAMLATSDFPRVTRGMKQDGLHFGRAGYQLLADLISETFD